MKRWIGRGIAVVGSLAVLTIATPTFAKSGAEAPGVGKEGVQTSKLTLSCQPGTTTGGQPQYVCTVRHITITHANTTLVFRALDSQQESRFTQGSYSQAGAGNAAHDDSGTILNSLSGVTITPNASNQKFTDRSETFMIAGAIPSNTVALAVGQYSPDRTKEYADEELVTLTPPVGQLPEVPFAVGVPLVGVGIGAVVWGRARKTAHAGNDRVK